MDVLKKMLLIVCLLPVIVFGETPAYKWGIVPKEILDCPVFWEDTSLAAVILFDIGTMEINRSKFDATTERHVRIKIFKDSGKEYAKIRIRYWHEDAIFNLRAQTILPNGKKITLKKKDIFYEGEKDRYQEAVFTIPGVENNSVIEYYYKISSEYLALLDPWEFQSDLYTLLSRFSLILPHGFEYTSYLKNGPTRDMKPVNEKLFDMNGNNLLSFIWELKNLEPLKDEPFMTTLNDYRCVLSFQLISYKDQYNNITFISTWNDLKKKIEPFYEPFLSNSRYLSELSEEITASVTSYPEKVNLLYNFVRDSIETTEYIGLTGDKIRSPRQIINQKAGSGVEKNLLLVALLRNAGLTANPLLISTRNHGKLDTTNPILRSFNHLIVETRQGSLELFLDAADRYCTAELLPYWDNNGNGLLLTKDEARIIDLQPPKSVSMGYSHSTLSIDSTGDAMVETVFRMEGYQGMRRKKELADAKDPKKYILNNLLDQLKNVEIDTFIIKNNIKEEPLTITILYKVGNFADMAGDKIFFSPALCQQFTENIFKSEKRNFAIDYPYPFIDQEEIVIKLPDGYLVEEIPSLKKFTIAGQEYFRSVTTTDTSLTCLRNHTLRKIRYDSWNYDVVKTFYAQIVTSDKDQVVLKKIAE